VKQVDELFAGVPPAGRHWCEAPLPARQFSNESGRHWEKLGKMDNGGQPHLKFLRNRLGDCPVILRKARVNELLLE
jgi:hypothetical protein